MMAPEAAAAADLGTKTSELVVVGAGLAGLVCASRVAGKVGAEKVVVLEAQPRVGGRLFAPVAGVDLGAAWSWPENDRELAALLADLGAETVPQPAKGIAMFQTKSDGARPMGRGQSPAGPGAVRIVGGAGSLCQRLVEKHALDVRLDTRVETIEVDEKAGDARVVTQDGSVFRARAVVVAVPPRTTVAQIRFSPALGDERRNAFRGTSTWMAEAGKICLLYKEKFWERAGLSGTVFAQGLPVSQVWDNSTDTQPALAGFVFGQNNLRYLDSEASFAGSPILSQLETVFGKHVREYEHVGLCAWDAHFAADRGVPEGPVPYGHPLLRAPHAGRIFFGATETTLGEQGHMEGAVCAGIRTAQEVMTLLRR